MKVSSITAACIVLAVACPEVFAHSASPTMTMPGMTFTVPRGTISGPVVVNNPTAPLPTTTIVNNGTVAGGASTGITVTGPTPTTVVNNGAITSNTKGISVSGSSSSTIVNSGTISVTSSGTGSAKATGITQGP